MFKNGYCFGKQGFNFVVFNISKIQNVSDSQQLLKEVVWINEMEMQLMKKAIAEVLGEGED